MGIKHLIQQNPEMEFNLVKLISKLDVSETKKLTPFLLKMFKKRVESWNSDTERGSNLYSKRYSNINNFLSDTNIFERYFLVTIIDQIGPDNIELLPEFITLLNKKLIENKDVSTYESMEDIINQISIARTKELMKNARKEILVIHEDDEVMMFKPLTFESSLKYGAGTKWCTAMKNEPEYFYRYSRNGILIYIINKKTGRKFGSYSDKFDSHISIYNEIDSPIDSFNLDISYDNIVKLMGFLDKKNSVNKTLFSENELKNYHVFNKELRTETDEMEVTELDPGEPQDTDPLVDIDGLFDLHTNEFINDNVGEYTRLMPRLRRV
jgi:hypothetical protein